METENWKVGDLLFYDNPFSIGCAKIERETPTTFILSSGERIRKGFRKPIGSTGYGVKCYYAEHEDVGKKIKFALVRKRKIEKIKSVHWDSLSDEMLDGILKILNNPNAQNNREKEDAKK